MTEEELNIVKYLSSFSALASLHIFFKNDQMQQQNSSFDGTDFESFSLQNIFVHSLFRQRCPLLQRLDLYELKAGATITKLVCSLDDSDPMPPLLGSPALDNYGFTAITKLNLKLSYDYKGWKEMVIEYPLSCCPNLFTFLLDVEFGDAESNLLDTFWWKGTFAPNKKLQRVSLQLHYRTDDLDNYPLEDDVIERFLTSTYFAQLKVTASYVEGGNSEYLELHYFIKNFES